MNNSNNNDKSLILIKSNNIYDFKDYIDLDIFTKDKQQYL